MVFKLIALLLVVAISGVAADEACFLPIKDTITTTDEYDFDHRYFQYPFLRPLRDQVPFCPNVDAKIDCSGNQRYRKPDGTCNNLNYRWWGSRFSPYQRLLEPDYTISRNLFIPRVVTPLNEALPDSRLVANKLKNNEIHSGLNAWFSFFGQILAHDLAHTPSSSAAYTTCECGSVDPECFNINIKQVVEEQIEECDEEYPEVCAIDPSVQECVPFPRSADVKNVFDCKFEQREQFTIGTHFLDLDIVYGASSEMEKNVRAFSNGTLKVDTVNSVPSLPILDINECLATGTNLNFRTKGCLYSGDARAGDHTFLSISMLLFVRAHNKIAEGLKTVNTRWSDEYLFQEARRILVGVYQNIVFSEYLDIAIGKETMAEFGLNTLETGYAWKYDDYLYPNNYNEFIAAGFRLHHTLHTEIIFLDKNFTIDAITVLGEDIEELRLHEMSFNSWLYYDQINTLMFTFVGEATYRAQFGMIASINHLMPLNADNDDPRRFPLGAANIQRARDHGIPGYGEYRVMAGHPLSKSWDDLFGIFLPETIAVLQSLYTFPADIDLWVGLIAEIPEPNQLLGKTQSWLVGKNFYNSKFGDRFYFENGQDKATRFSLEQLDNIRSMRFASLMCLGFGEFTEDNKMPEHGFFMPSSLTGEMEIVYDCPHIAPVNNLAACADLPAIDFQLWKRDYSKYY